MKKSVLFLGAFLMCLMLASCGPEESLFSLDTGDDRIFDERLLGEWRLRGTRVAKSDDSRLIFRRGEDATTYQILWTGAERKNHGAYLLSAHLVRLGDSLFIDIGTPSMDKLTDSEMPKSGKIPFPFIECHLFGRITIDKKNMQMDLLAGDWVEEQVKTGTLPLAFVKTPHGLVITATTVELRKFALEHAEDKEAFSDSESFYRSK